MATALTAHLSIDYRDSGPKDGAVVLLLHGWPDDATTWSAIAPTLNAAGLRTIAPTLRGFGATRFRSSDAPRTGNCGVLAMDAIDLLDQIGVDRFMVAGHDWGSNMAEAMAVGWPERVEKIAMLSSPPRLGGMPTTSFEQAQRQWYQWFQATKRGAAAIHADRYGFAHIMWVNWSPRGWFDEATFARVARSFENPDWVDVTLHSYRSRWDEAEPDPRGRWLDEKVRETKQLSVPALYFQGEVDGVNPPATSKDIAQKFSRELERIVLPGVGHFPTREAPGTVASRLVTHFRR